MGSVLEALVAIQGELKAPKDQNAGRYRYRNIEDINEAVKPLAAKNGCAVVYSDSFTADGACVSTCSLIGGDGQIDATGVAYVNRSPKNMSIEQASGAASSYARKYAACGLFAIDSSENDPDKTFNAPRQEERFDVALANAKMHLKAAIEGAVARGAISDAKGAMNGIPKRLGYEENKGNPEFFHAIAREFEEADG